MTPEYEAARKYLGDSVNHACEVMDKLLVGGVPGADVEQVKKNLMDSVVDLDAAMGFPAKTAVGNVIPGDPTAAPTDKTHGHPEPGHDPAPVEHPEPHPHPAHPAHPTHPKHK